MEQLTKFKIYKSLNDHNLDLSREEEAEAIFVFQFNDKFISTRFKYNYINPDNYLRQIEEYLDFRLLLVNGEFDLSFSFLDGSRYKMSLLIHRDGMINSWKEKGANIEFEVEKEIINKFFEGYLELYSQSFN